MLKKRQLIFFFVFFLAFIPIAYSADDQYKSYLHKPVVPEHPKLKLYGKYQTNLFPGAGTYTYPIEVPKGTNNLQPSISISYNSQTVKQRPSILGAGWTLTQNYIYRDVNFTPSNVTDDEFKLILNSAPYNLIYDTSDNFYHTEIESFPRIQNLSNASNTYNMYWLVTLKDGTKLRFGYNSDSELTSNTGYSYALKWSLDQVEDTHGNKISYSYNENPYPQDNGSVYLSQILYNNDQKRKIEFGYESSVRPDRRRVYEQGNVLEESRRLNDISILFNDTLVRRYNFEYNSLNNESSLSSLSKIKYIGSDNSSTLHTITFGYYQSTSYYTNSTTYNTSVLFSNSAGEDFGVRLIDLNNDGYIDMIQGRGSTSEKKAWLNNKTGWNESNSFAPPEFFVYNAYPQVGLDRGLRIADINNDGLSDLIQGWGGVRKAWLNNVTGWREDSTTWAPSIDFASSSGTDEGTQLVDFNGDGRVDILQAKESGAVKKAYLNTGNGWKDVSSLWISPTYFVKSDSNDFGSRLVDVNGDGLIDIIEGYNFGTETKNAWLNNGSGWIKSTAWNPPDVFTSSSRTDNGMRFVDLNGDGLTDIFQDYKNGSTTEREAFINNGNGWSNSSSWTSPEPFTKDGKNVGRRIGDIDGNGLGDIIIGYNDGTSDIKRTLVRNSTIPYLLKNITNEYGGITYLYYSKSTLFNNTGDDGISDIGFNVWVVSNVTQDNSLPSDFNVLSNTSYYYFGGLYSYNDSEFRGFNIVNETLADKSVISHYFHQNKQLKGQEFKTETYDSAGNIFSKTENNFNFTTTNYSYFIVNLLSTSTYLHDGVSTGPKITNISYKYDAYGNILSKTTFGDVSLQGDEKYENYTYAYNQSSWILGKVSWYLLFDSSHNKIRETKYFYDNHEYGAPPSKGDLTKIEQWLDTGGGNPTTRFRYDNFGNLIEQVDPLGRVTKFEYGLTDITSTYPERAINALGHKTDFVYDVGTGNLISETKNAIKKSYQYDVFGRITKEVLPYDDSDFPTKSYTYSFDGIAPESIKISQRTTSNKTIDIYYFYDGFGNFIQVKSPSDNGQVVKNILYDRLFRVKEDQNPYFESFSATLSNVSNATNITKYSYDALGRITSVINPDGTTKNITYSRWEINDYDENNNKHTYHLDAYDRIIAVTEYNTEFYLLDNETYNTTYSYNGRDELTGIRDTYGNEFNFTYDSLGRKIKLKDPDLGTWNYEYDLTGNLVKQTDNKGSQISKSYDGINRILQKNASSQIISFAYDKQYQGTLSNISINNNTFVYTYDDKLRIIKEELKLRHQTFVTGLTYDSADRILEKVMPNRNDRDYYYNPQGKIDKIRGYINKTNYNALGNSLNKTYFNNKITAFDYYQNNARLRQIKTDSIQQLNYTYDNVGNIIFINDSANNRNYAMSYDRLDRLTNVTINSFSWVYHYDAIGRVLKVVRNNSQTTSLKYNNAQVHFPSKSITTNTGVDIYRQSDFNTSSKTKIVQFYLINEKNASVTNVNWTAEFGDNSLIESNIPFNLSTNENILVIVEHNYSKGGNYITNVSGRASSSSDYETLNIIFGAIANSLGILKQNATLIVSDFTAKNTINEISVNWSWNCSNNVFSTIPFNMSPNEELLVVMEHNYSLSSGNLSCSVFSADGNQSKSTTIAFDGIKIENYNSTVTDRDTVLVKFNIRNYFSTLDVNWNITANGNIYRSSSPVTLSQGQASTVSQEINFTKGGLKQIKTSIGSGNFTDSYNEYYFISWININEFFTTVKNATARVFDFLIKNVNEVNATATWNITNPALQSAVNLSGNESLIVVIEEDYPQGKKEVTISIFNGTTEETNLLEVFKIRQISIESLQTLHESDKTVVISSIVKNNIQPLNLSWRLNNTQEVIASTQNLELNTSEQVIVVIESNFSSSGIYPLTLMINSSSYNDNATGVAVS